MCHIVVGICFFSYFIPHNVTTLYADKVASRNKTRGKYFLPHTEILYLILPDAIVKFDILYFYGHDCQ